MVVFEAPPLCSNRCRCVRIVALVLLLLISPLLLVFLPLRLLIISPVLLLLISPLPLLLISPHHLHLHMLVSPLLVVSSMLLFIVSSPSSSSFPLLSMPCSPFSSSSFPSVFVVASQLIHVDPLCRFFGLSFRPGRRARGVSKGKEDELRKQTTTSVVARVS